MAEIKKKEKKSFCNERFSSMFASFIEQFICLTMCIIIDCRAKGNKTPLS